MFHFFAKIGRTSSAKIVLPMIATSTGVGYLGFHFFGHNITRNLLAAHSASGRREEISQELQSLIMSVYKDIQNSFNQPMLKVDFFVQKAPTIKWFCSSTMEPVVFGMTEANTGVLIGLPVHYNFNSIEDVTSDALEFHKLQFFKSTRSDEKGGEKDEPRFDAGEDILLDERTGLTTINKDSPEGKKYVDSLLLSENAKRFSIARELFESDSYKPLAVTGIIFLSWFISIFLSRAVVLKMSLKDAHLSQRIPFYLVSGITGMFNFVQLSNVNQQFYCKRADEKAMMVGEAYHEGAKEYFHKLIQRNQALRNLIGDLKALYDEEGNVITPFFQVDHMNLTERLKLANQMDPSFVNKTV